MPTTKFSHPVDTKQLVEIVEAYRCRKYNEDIEALESL